MSLAVRQSRFNARAAVVRMLDTATAAYAGLLALIMAANAVGPEQLWPAAANMYLPQLAWLAPGLAIGAAAFVWRRRLVLPAALCCLCVIGPIMGVRWRRPHSVPGVRVRVMTYNIAEDIANPAALSELTAARADIVCLQEVNAPINAGLARRNGWYTAGQTDCNVLSRFPLKSIEIRSMPLEPPWRKYMRCEVEVGDRTVAVYCMHLDSPRESLSALRARGPFALGAFRGAIRERVDRARALAQTIRAEAHGPTIVAGDFNAPEQSLVCRALLDTGLRDAFSQAGVGYGYTYGHSLILRRSYVRIDHILTDSSWAAVGCRVGGARGSDHRPVIADLVLRPR